MKKLVVLLIISLFCTISEAKEVAGVAFPETLNNYGPALTLNGAGLRTKYFMDMYVGGLYLKQKNTIPEKIISADEPMAIRLQIISSLITSEKMESSTREGFVNATSGNTEPIKDNIEKFISVFREKIDKNDFYEMVYVPGEGTKVYKNGALKTTVTGLPFKQALFGIWLCQKPAQESLKKEMLGQ